MSRMAAPFSYSLKFPGWEWVFGVIQIGVILVAGILLIGLSVRALDALAERRQFDPLTFRPVRTAVKWLGVLVIAALVLGKFGFDILTALSAVLALIAVGFVAVWSVLSNFLCTFLIILFRPFRIDDWIEFPADEGVRGRVVELTTLYTVLEDEEGAIYHIPNNQFFQKVIKKSRRKTGPS